MKDADLHLFAHKYCRKMEARMLSDLIGTPPPPMNYRTAAKPEAQFSTRCYPLLRSQIINTRIC